MKKICFFYSDITGTGGIEKMISIIGNKLVEEDEYKVNILSVKEKNSTPFFYFDNKIKIDALEKKEDNGNLLKIISLLRKYIKVNKIDILIVCNIATDIIAIPATRLSKVKVISWEHFGFDDNISNKRIELARFIATKFSDYIIVLTKDDEEKYKKNFHITKKVKLLQLYNPIEIQDYNDTIKDTKNILTIGHFTYVKGYDMLLEIAKVVLNRYKDWKWTIIGDGKLKEEFMKKIKEENLEKQIVIKSRVKNVSEYYKNSEIYVNTSRSEGFPITILEAKSYNLPIVAFKIPGINEMVRDGVNSMLANRYDIECMKKNICELINNKEKRISFSKNAKIDIDKFSLNTILEQWKKIIDNV